MRGGTLDGHDLPLLIALPLGNGSADERGDVERLVSAEPPRVDLVAELIGDENAVSIASDGRHVLDEDHGSNSGLGVRHNGQVSSNSPSDSPPGWRISPLSACLAEQFLSQRISRPTIAPNVGELA